MTNHPSPDMASPDAADRGDSAPAADPSPMAAAAAGAVGPGALAAAERGGDPTAGDLTPDDIATLSRLVRRVGVGAIRRFLERPRDTP